MDEQLKREVHQRLAQLQRLKDQQVADLNATLGAIKECRHWLERLEESRDPRVESREEIPSPAAVGES